jgi:hypothetical protein
MLDRWQQMTAHQRDDDDIVSPQPVFHGGFDYSMLSGNTRRAAAEAAARVRARLRRTVEDIIATGNDLIAIKEILPHGLFGVWLRAEFAWSERSAERFMRAARWAAGKSATVANLMPASVYTLAEPSMPAAVTQAVLERLEHGEAVTHADVRKLARAARRNQAQGEDRQTAPAGAPPASTLPPGIPPGEQPAGGVSAVERKERDDEPVQWTAPLR